MVTPHPPPRISVVIPTRNRAALLECSLRSLESQTLPIPEFEVIVVDDGSIDSTAAVCQRWSSRLPLTGLRLEGSGIAAAKNMGILAAAGPIILFFDDDDVADERLLVEHLGTHASYPSENVAVLGYTDWAPSLNVTEVMHYVTDVGHDLFSYSDLEDGQRLGYTYFWGGRTSCKKALLAKHGVHREEFTFGSEDIELAYRISKLLVKHHLVRGGIAVDTYDEESKHSLITIGVSVIFNRRAIQFMNRPVTFDEFCRRCERQGRSQTQFSRLYRDSLVHQWGRTTGALDRWSTVRNLLPMKVARVREIETKLAGRVSTADREDLLPELHDLYRWTFDAFKAKGIVDGGLSAEPVRACNTA